MKYRDDLKFYSAKGELIAIKEFPESIAEESGLAYEVIRVNNSIPLFVSEHLQRLNNSLQIGGFPKCSINNIEKQISNLIENNGVGEGNLKIVIRVEEESIIPYLYFIPHRYPSVLQIEDGVKTILQYDTRSQPTAKFSDWKIRGAANKIIDTENVYETILVNDRDSITEGSRSNVFFVKGEKLFTAPDNAVLPGITRDKVIAIAETNGVNIDYSLINIDDLNNYDACFLTGTSPGVIQIRKVNEVNYKTNHPVYMLLQEEYKKLT